MKETLISNAGKPTFSSTLSLLTLLHIGTNFMSSVEFVLSFMYSCDGVFFNFDFYMVLDDCSCILLRNLKCLCSCFFMSLI